jgi:hypothetical protein
MRTLQKQRAWTDIPSEKPANIAIDLVISLFPRFLLRAPRKVVSLPVCRSFYTLVHKGDSLGILGFYRKVHHPNVKCNKQKSPTSTTGSLSSFPPFLMVQSS